MAINFNELPNKKPESLLPEGAYYATIGKAELRTPKDDPSKPDYLSIELKLKNKDGKECGTVYDNLTESDKDIAKYKVGRFIRAIGMMQQFAAAGVFSLKDLQKIVSGKTVIVDIGKQDAKNGYPAKNQVDALTREGYYMATETEAFGGDAVTIPVVNATVPTTGETTDDVPFDEAY